MARDQVMFSDVIFIFCGLFAKYLGAGRRVCTLVALGKPLINACTAGFEYVKKNGFFHYIGPLRIWA